MINTESEVFIFFKIVFWVTIFFIFYYPIPNLLKILDFKKKNKFWNEWLSRGLSHEEYIQKHHQDKDNAVCYFCNFERRGHQLHQALPKEITFGGIQNSISDKNIHFLSFYCSRCGSELYRHSHEV
ncbi:MAG: hypothetical protein RLZZ410_440 [Pseudomonadota bacterium]|jgi:hypothetical protein